MDLSPYRPTTSYTISAFLSLPSGSKIVCLAMTCASLPTRRRVSNTLSPIQSAQLFTAYRRSRNLGVPLNCHLSINWAFAPGGLHPVVRWFRFSDCARRWLRERGVPFTWVYVWERGVGETQHLHLVLHVPTGFHADFKPKVADWVRASTDSGGFQDRAVDVRFQRTPSLTGLMKYLIKDADRATRQRFDAEKNWPQRGRVEGKRSEVSLNLRDTSWPDLGDGPVVLETFVVQAA